MSTKPGQLHTVHCPDSLLAWLAVHGECWESVDFAWQHPQFAEFPPEIMTNLGHARRLSCVRHGASLLYNLMLAELAGREPLRDEFREGFAQWSDEFEADIRPELAEWDLGELWRVVRRVNPRLSPNARRFCERWVHIVAASHPAWQVADHRQARRLVRERELQLKGGRARLSNPAARANWGESSGLTRLDYRWSVAQDIIMDILRGLAGEQPDA